MFSRSTRLVAALSGAAVAATVSVVALTGTEAAHAATLTFTPSADTRVQDNTPTTNYGTSTVLGVDASEIQRSFLKFSLSGITEPIQSVKLRLHVDDVAGAESSNGGTWKLMSNTSWSETAVTWNNQPAIDGTTLGTLGTVARNTWVEIDLTGKITGNGTYSLGGTSTSTNGADYDSRETTLDPQIVVTTGTTPPPSGDPVLVGAGDIASSGSGDSATAALINNLPNATVFTLGDNVYSNGTATEFTNYYDPTWGAFKSRTRPAPGNHDYNTSGATGYYNYFGTQAGPSGRGYYSYDLGNWHIVSLNSEVSMAAGSAQETWLRQDLAASSKPCTAAYWHKPLFTSASNHAPETATRPLFQALYDNDAEIVMAGHNHNYERFAPMNPQGGLDNTNGIQSFVAGMGGVGFYGFGTIQPNSLARNNDTFGVLKLTLHSNSWDWAFVPQAGKTYNDSGTGTCH